MTIIPGFWQELSITMPGQVQTAKAFILMYNAHTMKNRMFFTALFVIVCVALGSGVGFYFSRDYSENNTVKPAVEGLLWPNPRIIQPFSVVDQHGKSFGLENLSGRWSFIFFGFTHCPDICPITLSVLSQVQKKLAAKDTTDNVQIIFVSVDPKRDTPDQVANYVSFFSENLIGLTGTEEQIAGLARQIGVMYVENKENSQGDYSVDHSASVFLISPAGQWLGIFSAPHEVDNIIRKFDTISEYIKKQG
jgi:protein SCO1/2